ncbi:MAG: ABC transporter ATP-binding protein [Cyanobacteriota bacterium]|nr:ABC transporter ATP-binding protein [Cyanobacteriota bacterium]
MVPGLWRAAGRLRQILRPWLEASPVSRLITSTALAQWRLVTAGVASSVLLAFLEGCSFTVIFLAVRVVTNPGLPALPASWGPWSAALATRLAGVAPGSLFILLLAVALLLQIAASLTRYGNGLALGYFSARCQARVMPLMHRWILSLSYGCASSFKAGDLIARVSSAANAVQTQIEESGQLVCNLLLVGVYVLILGTISPWMLLIAAALVVVIGAIQGQLRPRISRASRGLEQYRRELSTQIEQDIQVLRLLHSIGGTERAARVLNAQAGRLELRMRGLVRLMQLIEPVGELLPVAAATVIAATSLPLFGGPEQTLVAKLATFVLALQRLNLRMAKVAMGFNRLSENSGRLFLLNQLLDSEGKQFRRVGGIPFQGLRKSICFEGVELVYANRHQPALTAINLEIPVGSTLALVGLSGAGKSSLTDLLVGLLAPTAGRISVDGIDLQSIELNSWQQRIGIVSQDFQVVNASVADNITFGRPGVSLPQIEAAARFAGAAGFIAAMPNGYASILGERGHRLSGGQRQRISLARALLSEPELLILDEATSALDSHSEGLILDNLRALPGTRTVVMVAHRLSSITHADRIVVLEGGRIVEEGRHEELLALGGTYSGLWQRQAREHHSDARELHGYREHR